MSLTLVQVVAEVHQRDLITPDPVQLRDTLLAGLMARNLADVSVFFVSSGERLLPYL